MFSFPIWHPNFDYTVLWRDIPSVMAYSSFVFCLVSFYLVKNYVCRATIFLLTLLLTLYAHRIAWITCPLLMLYLGVYYYGLNGKRILWKNIAFVSMLIFSIAILFIKVPGIQNWQIVSQWALTPDAIPYSMRFTFNKSLIGLFFVWFSACSLANNGNWKPTLKIGVLTGCVSILVLIPLSFLLGYVKIDVKLTYFFYLWLTNNLFFVCFAEEALFRGLIQNTLMTKWQFFKHGKWYALGISAGLFGLAHFAGGIKYVLLATVAGLFYGYAFMKTRKIEASVITHLMVNTTHFLAFTYPALKTAFG